MMLPKILEHLQAGLLTLLILTELPIHGHQVLQDLRLQPKTQQVYRFQLLQHIQLLPRIKLLDVLLVHQQQQQEILQNLRL